MNVLFYVLIKMCDIAFIAFTVYSVTVHASGVTCCYIDTARLNYFHINTNTICTTVYVHYSVRFDLSQPLPELGGQVC